MKAVFTLASVGLLMLAVACSQPPAPARESGAPSAQEPISAVVVAGVGTVTALSPTSVTIQHGPIEVINLKAATTEFTAQSGATLRGVKVGDFVVFQLQGVGAPRVVVAIAKQ